MKNRDVISFTFLMVIFSVFTAWGYIIYETAVDTKLQKVKEMNNRNASVIKAIKEEEKRKQQ